MAKRKGQFKKGGGRIGDRSTAIVRTAPRAPAKRRAAAPARTRTVYKTRRSGGGRAGLSGTEKLAALAIGGLGLAAIFHPNSKIATSGSGLRNLVDKIPGTKTVGPIAAVGLAAGAVDHFFWKNRWLRLAGKIGVVAAAIDIGGKLGSGQEVKWLGDYEGGEDEGSFQVDAG